VAASPRVFGVMADRLPLQGAFGAAVAGVAVCAVAREHGMRRPAEWVRLLGQVILERDVGRPRDTQVVPPAHAAAPPPEAGPLRRAGGMLWRLARVLWDVQDLFDDRPRGSLVWRAVGKVPLVGLAGGVLDERGAVARAAAQTSRLIEAAAGGASDAVGPGTGPAR
jgi:hypothetical protein